MFIKIYKLRNDNHDQMTWKITIRGFTYSNPLECFTAHHNRSYQSTKMPIHQYEAETEPREKNVIILAISKRILFLKIFLHFY